MADPAFYEQADARQTIERYQKAKKELEVAMEEWELSQEELDEMEG